MPVVPLTFALSARSDSSSSPFLHENDQIDQILAVRHNLHLNYVFHEHDCDCPFIRAIWMAMNTSCVDAKDRKGVNFNRGDSMWRSFFYALGVGLMVLGGEALIFERVTLNPDTKLPSFAQRILDSNETEPNLLQKSKDQYAFGEGRQANGMPNLRNSNGGHFPKMIPASSTNGIGYSSQSRFGPSRFAGPANGGYGGGRIGFGQNTASGNSYEGSGRTPAQVVSTSNTIGVGVSEGRKRPRKQIITKDWMPWSLIAVGAVIFLYTHTSRGRYSD